MPDVTYRIKYVGRNYFDSFLLNRQFTRIQIEILVFSLDEILYKNNGRPIWHKIHVSLRTKTSIWNILDVVV
jgi:hypothetical protein